jgi:hypothetical protein
VVGSLVGRGVRGVADADRAATTAMVGWRDGGGAPEGLFDRGGPAGLVAGFESPAPAGSRYPDAGTRAAGPASDPSGGGRRTGPRRGPAVLAAAVIAAAIVVGGTALGISLLGHDDKGGGRGGGATAGPPRTPGASSPAATGTPAVSGISAPVVPAGAAVATWLGPSTSPSTYGRRGSVTGGTRVTVICTLYAQEVAAVDGRSRLWDYTSAGWLNDQYVDTRSPSAVAPACAGNVYAPRVGTGAPRRDTGPFPVVDDGGGVTVRARPGGRQPALRTLRDGDVVDTVCYQDGDLVPPPTRVAGAHGSSQWDRLAGGGWVPDANVNSSTSTSAAPPC